MQHLVSTCLHHTVKTFARRREKSVQQLLSRVRENERAPLNQPVVAGCGRQAVIVRTPAFQAGCRGFEPRLPLQKMNRLFTGSPEAASWQASGDTVSKEAVLQCAKTCTATSCLILRIASCKICLYNHFKLHTSQRIVGMFSKIILAFPPTLETAGSGVRCKNRGRFYVRQAKNKTEASSEVSRGVFFRRGKT